MPASTYTGNLILNATLRGVAYTLPSRVFVSLHNADPGLTGINEITVGLWPAYARQDPAQGAAIGTGFGAPLNKVMSNAKVMNYGIMNGAVAVTITHFAIWDALTSGNVLVYGPLTVSKALAPSDECMINIDRLQATVI